MRVTFAVAARAEAMEARRCCEAISPELALDFAGVVEQTVRRVTQDPLMWPPLTTRIRRCLSDRFPYALIYPVDGNEPYILSVMHQRRKPGYWRGR